MNEVYCLTCEVPPKSDHKSYFHQLRDGHAAMEIIALLLAAGYRYGGVLRNPPEGKSAEVLPLCDGDVVLMANRPFLNDAEEERVVRKGKETKYWLEQAIYDRLKKAIFAYCSRGTITIHNPIAQAIELEERGYAAASFGRNAYLGDVDPPECATASDHACSLAYLIYMPIVIPARYRGTGARGPMTCHLFNAFGASGTATLLWSYLLRVRYWQEWGLDLSKPRFLMALIRQEAVPRDAVSLTYARGWTATRLADFPLTERYIAEMETATTKRMR